MFENQTVYFQCFCGEKWNKLTQQKLDTCPECGESILYHTIVDNETGSVFEIKRPEHKGMRIEKIENPPIWFEYIKNREQ